MRVWTEFHAVGQGLFSVGHLYGDGPAGFSWVYDCGSLNDKLGLDKAIDAVCRSNRHRPYYPYWPRQILDLVVLSHFDQDHVNGFTKLMTKFRVDTLVIPLVPFALRLEVLFSLRGYVDKANVQFFLDPVATIRRRYGDRIKRIILVPSSGGPDDFIGNDESIDEPPDEPKTSSNHDWPHSKVRATRGWRRSTDYGDLDGPLVYELPKGARLSAFGEWEFIPYVEAWAFTQADEAFSLKAEQLRDELLSTSSKTERIRKSALARLKRHYKTVFDTPKRKNRISLFLYAGVMKNYPDIRVPSILYCGDGYLSSRTQWEALEAYLSASRLSHLGVLQVAHHGSKHNWHPGLGQALRPTYAVFSADPNHHFGFPHKEVEQDFARCSSHTLVTGKRNKTVSQVFVA